MADRITANLPARDLVATAAFYARLGFTEEFRDEGWMILSRGELEVSSFPIRTLIPQPAGSRPACVWTTPARCWRNGRVRACPEMNARYRG